ncbi:MAG: hypothetical protein CMF75_06135 [Maricaulis sp.]|nr:hypothetical protein [Maricaulis sp.]
MTPETPTPPISRSRQIERWTAIAMTLGLTPIAAYYAIGILGLPIERLVDLDPTTRFDDVRRMISPVHVAALILSGAGATASLLLQILDSRWSLPAHILYFIGAKTGWIMASFLANYDGLMVGAVTSIFQLSVLVILVRTQGGKWFPQRRL